MKKAAREKREEQKQLQQEQKMFRDIERGAHERLREDASQGHASVGRSSSIEPHRTMPSSRKRIRAGPAVKQGKVLQESGLRKMLLMSQF